MVDKKMTKTTNRMEKNLPNKSPSLKVKEILPSLRGRTFKGTVIKKFPGRVSIELERTVYVKKYERYAKKKTKLHARLPQEFSESIDVGDYIEVKECRPLSKIIHFIVIKKIRSKGGIEK